MPIGQILKGRISVTESIRLSLKHTQLQTVFSDFHIMQSDFTQVENYT